MVKPCVKKYGEQLGMNLARAERMLSRDLLFHFITESGHRCYRCGNHLERSTFTIDHKTPWRNKENASSLYFDMDNIAFSCRACNSKAGINQERKPCGTHAAFCRGCRCEACKKSESKYRALQRARLKLKKSKDGLFEISN